MNLKRQEKCLGISVQTSIYLITNIIETTGDFKGNHSRKLDTDHNVFVIWQELPRSNDSKCDPTPV